MGLWKSFWRISRIALYHFAFMYRGRRRTGIMPILRSIESILQMAP